MPLRQAIQAKAQPPNIVHIPLSLPVDLGPYNLQDFDRAECLDVPGRDRGMLQLWFAKGHPRAGDVYRVDGFMGKAQAREIERGLQAALSLAQHQPDIDDRFAAKLFQAAADRSTEQRGHHHRAAA